MKKLISALLVLVLVLASASALAEWPERAIELIVPANPGGDTDANARALAAALNETLGWNVVVSNMAGGSGAVAFEDVAGNPDDGYRWVFYHSGGNCSELMGVYDFTILGDYKLAGMPIMDYTSCFLINSKNAKFQDLPSMVEYMKAHPGEVTFATETGNFTHLHALAFQAAAGVEFQIVDAGTASQKITALLGNELDVIDTQAGLSTVAGYLKTGEFICLGLVADEGIRPVDEAMPYLPSIKEQGFENVVFPKFFYLAADKSVSDEIVAAMNAGLKAVIENEGLKTYADGALLNLNYLTVEESAEFYAQQSEMYKEYLADYID